MSSEAFELAGTGRVPEFDLADRLRKSLRESDLGVSEMAEYLETSRNTIGNWINGHTRPRPAELKMWALRTGVDYGWLVEGEPQAQGGYTEFTPRSNHGLLHLQPDHNAPATTQDIVGEFRRSIHGTPKSTARRIESARAA